MIASRHHIIKIDFVFLAKFIGISVKGNRHSVIGCVQKFEQFG